MNKSHDDLAAATLEVINHFELADKMSFANYMASADPTIIQRIDALERLEQYITETNRQLGREWSKADLELFNDLSAAICGEKAVTHG